MAINSFEKRHDKLHETSPSGSGLVSSNFKLNVKGSCYTSGDSKSSRLKTCNILQVSPYLSPDSFQLLSKFTERKVFHKKETDVISSFPLAANIYKANSDEFKSSKGSKKVKKSVLTLPNVPAAIPQTCTVSDMNDSEYFGNGSGKTRPKKRYVPSRKRKVRNKNYEFYDRDARYCSQMNIDLDCSSTDMMKHFNGEHKSMPYNKYHSNKTRTSEGGFNGNNVWAVLRNINRFQFRPSPPMSEDSLPTPKTKKIRNKRRNNRNNTQVIKTCHTEEFAYISNYEIDSKSASFSASSSFDRITVIDKQDEYNQVCDDFNNTCITKKKYYKSKNREKKTFNQKNKLKAITHNFKKDQNEIHLSQHDFNKDHNDAEINSSNITSKIMFPSYQQKNETDLMTKYEMANDLSQTNLVNDSCNEISKTLHFESKPALSSKLFLNDPIINSKSNNKIQKCILKENTSKAKNEQWNSNRNQPLVKNSSDKTKVHSLGTKSDDVKYMHRQKKKEVGQCKETEVGQCKETCETFSSKTSEAINNSSISSKVFLTGDTETLLRKASDESNPQIEGITKVIFSRNPQGSPSKRKYVPKRNSNVASSEGNGVVIPKLTQTDIKKRLAKLKFPIVVLGKDELGSTSIHVMDYDPPHFEGLNRKIWPFMQQWLHAPNQIVNEFKDERKASKLKNKDICKTKSTLGDDDTIAHIRFKKDLNDCNKLVQRPADVTKTKIGAPKIIKPMHQLKDKMLQLLYKNNFIKETDEQIAPLNVDNKIISLVEKQTFTVKKADACIGNNYELTPPIARLKLSPRLEKNKSLIFAKYPWGKEKRASDFIENVIRKIKCGIYYNRNTKNKTDSRSKEASVQTNPFSKDIYTRGQEQNKYDVNLCTDSKPAKLDDCLDALLSIDETIAPLEIKAMNIKEVAIKHCTTNLMVHFDVTIPNNSQKINPEVLNNALPFIPISKMKSQGKIFKCKTTILNAMLPAEICSILPRMMKFLLDTHKLLQMPTPTTNQNDSPLYTISELTPCQSTNVIKPVLSSCVRLSPFLRKLSKGVFSSVLNINGDIVKLRNRFKCPQESEILPKYLPARFLMSAQIYPLGDMFSKEKIRPNLNVTSPKSVAPCTTLQIYKPQHYDKQMACDNSKNKTCGFQNILEQLWKHNFTLRFKVSIVLPAELNVQKDNDITILQRRLDEQFDNKPSTLITLEIDSLITEASRGEANTVSTHRMIEYKKDIKNKKENKVILNIAKTRKTSFVRLYKKCKSTSNICSEKNSTSLDNITNLDEFFLAMGPGKVMSSIFDGKAGKKIMSSVTEMKNWITVINQRQAMLVLLLANKKDTPNLMRLRSFLLQGIAVNRITRASELDMEMDVIQRENFNILPECEGIHYLPESVENHRNLLDELYWIAKTTASDYQKPFNESSEKFLKSLLEKRKKLNPSYLRVMARYVGLGLLKMPSKH